MLTTRKLVLSAAILLSTAFALATSAAFANAPGGAYIQCDGSQSSPVRCMVVARQGALQRHGPGLLG